MSKLWILTEERPKREVIEIIFRKFAKEKEIGFISSGSIKIIPLIQNQSFTFTYEVLGINTPKVSQILIKTISGQSSFVDYLIYYQEDEPIPSDFPLFAIEETKTDDSESRNTGIYQRCTKFVYIDLFYEGVKKIMLYSLQVEQKEKPTSTNVFGSKLLATYGIEVLGKIQNQDQITPFNSIDELIKFKNSMRRPPKGNTPILIYKSTNEIKISGRLSKAGSLSHDPNIGALSMISAVLRKLGWKDKITIIQHGLIKSNLPKNSVKPNKFIQIANKLNIGLEDLDIPYYLKSCNKNYWNIERNGEKLGTIFMHLVVDAFTQGYSIFENHAGCEKSYFRRSDGSITPLEKYSDRIAYKVAGDKTAIAHIPDLILIDVENLEIINIEGKKYEYRYKGISELNNYDFIEKEYIKKSYDIYDIIRTVILYGSNLKNNSTLEAEIGFLLNRDGKIILGISAPKLFRDAINNLLDYWKYNIS